MKLALLLVVLLFFPTISAVPGKSEDQASTKRARSLRWIRPSRDGTHFVAGEAESKVEIWGVNYDHDDSGDLLEDYWHTRWPEVVEDFQEIKDLGGEPSVSPDRQ